MAHASQTTTGKPRSSSCVPHVELIDADKTRLKYPQFHDGENTGLGAGDKAGEAEYAAGFAAVDAAEIQVEQQQYGCNFD